METKRIFEGMSPAQPNFKIVATHVRHGASGSHYVLQDSAKLKAVVEKWRFAPSSEPLSRCGYDYLIVFTNGAVTVPVSICFVCNMLIYNHTSKFKTSRKQIMTLFAEDFTPVP